MRLVSSGMGPIPCGYIVMLLLLLCASLIFPAHFTIPVLLTFVNRVVKAWYPPALDTSTGTTYWGTGNAAPWPGTPQYPNGSSRPGPNLYTDSELALTHSGQLQWYQQVKPHC